MYESYYGFKANPFRIAPDPSFFFASAGHKRGLAYLRYGLHQGQGFVVVTGEPGTGKTMLVQTLLSELSGKSYRVATISNTNLRADDVLRAVAENFGIEQRDARNKAELLTFIQRFLHEQHAQGRKSLLIIDEAQNLPPRSLEELRMLSNFQIGHEGLLQIVLAGQPQLRKTLAAPSMEQLSQRIIAGCHLKPISAIETRAYISHRMRRVGWSGVPEFTGEALSLIYQMSRGIPRLINIFVDRLLLASALEEKSSIDEARVRSVVDELRHENHGAWNDSDLDAHNINVELALSPLPESSSSVKASSARKSAAAANKASSAKVQLEASPGSAERSVKTRPRIVKAVASGGHAGKAQAAQLVQVKWPKKVATETVVAARPVQQRTREQVKAEMLLAAKKKQQAELAARKKDMPSVTSEVKAKPEQSRPSRDPNVIDLPLSKKHKTLDEGLAELGDNFQMIDEPANTVAVKAERTPDIDTSLVEEINARSDDDDTLVISDAPALSADPEDHRDLFSDEKRGPSSLLWIMIIGVLVIGGAIFAYLSMDGDTSVPIEVGVNGEVSQELVASMFTPPEPEASAAEYQAEASVGTASSTSMSEPVPEWELADLMYTFILAYENGNVSLFSTLFSGKAKMDGHSGRNQITSYYEKLFQDTEMRSMAVNGIKWSTRGNKIHGEAYFELNHWYRGKDRPDTKSGQFVIDVVRANNRLQIFQVEYVDI